MKKNNRLGGWSGFSAVGVIIGIAAAVLFGVAAYLIIDGANNATNYKNYDFYSVIEPTKDNGFIGDHVKGNTSAPTVIYEYADYQCPACASMNKRVNKAIEESNGKLAVVYRSYLLPYHQNGTVAASAAEAAGLQGYWEEYANKLFDKQSEWEYASADDRSKFFDKYFEEVTDGKGDMDKFHADIASDEVSKKISFDMGIGKRIDIEGTPAFYVDGQHIKTGEASSITVNGKEIKWDKARTGDEFVSLLVEIAETGAEGANKSTESKSSESKSTDSKTTETKSEK